MAVFMRLFNLNRKLAAKAGRAPGTPQKPVLQAVASGAPRVKSSTAATIDSIEELPRFRRILTADGEELSIPDERRRLFAILETSGKSILVLCTEAAQQNPNLMSCVDRARRAGFKLNGRAIVSVNLLLRLYEQEKEQKESTKGQEVKDDTESSLLFREIVLGAIKERASDIHILIRDQYNSGRVLVRCDGVIRPLTRDPYSPSKLYEAISVAYTTLADERSRSEPSFNPLAAQSCAIPFSSSDTVKDDWKLRYQSIPVVGGVDVILRLLPTGLTDDGKGKALEELGYSPSQCHQLELANRKNVGLIIVAGVTGAGKSTTLKCLLTSSEHRMKKKTYTIEDPAEYKIYGASQISVQRSSSAGDNKADANPFIESMRTVMRADPDVVMVGEVRDKQSGSMMKTMVQTGHKVLTTVHAASAIEIVERLVSEEIGLHRQTLSSRNFLSALVYQHLVPLSCSHCRKPAKGIIPAERLDMIAEKFKLSDMSKIHVVNPSGCPRCRDGVKGVTVAAEVIAPDLEFLKLIREGKDGEAEEYWRGTRSHGFEHPDMTGKTALEHAVFKMTQGLVDPANVEDVFEPFETYRIFDMKGY